MSGEPMDVPVLADELASLDAALHAPAGVDEAPTYRAAVRHALNLPEKG